jgi:hypothetical protein
LPPRFLKSGYGPVWKLKITNASIALFEKAIASWPPAGAGSSMKVTIWRYYLAAAYAQLMHKDNSTRCNEFNPNQTMSRIKELLEIVIASGKEHNKPFLVACCYVDLASTFWRYQRIRKAEDRCVQISMTVEECYAEALTMCCGQDPHVMEKYGQHLRRIACDAPGLEKAVQILKDVLTKYPHRHVAAHHLALTYKALWFDEAKVEHRYIYKNNDVFSLLTKTQKIFQ